MQLPNHIDERVIKVLTDLLQDAQKVTKSDRFTHSDHDDFIDLQTKFLFVLKLLSAYKNGFLDDIYARVVDLRPVHLDDFVTVDAGLYTDFATLVGLIRSVKYSHEMDLLGNLTEIVAKSISDDYAIQAEQLFNQNYDLPAAVLLGAVLEDTLRRLCQRQNPPLPTTESNGKPKTLNPLIDDLKRAGIYNELKAKQLRAWAGIRNAAAHGESSKFNHQDVEQMLMGVRIFLADYL